MCIHHTLFILQLMDTSVVFHFLLLWITLLWTVVHKFLRGHRISFLLDVYTAVEPLDHITLMFNILLFSRSVFVTPWTAARQTSLSFTISQSLPKLMSIELVMPSTHLVVCCPFSCLQSCPVSGSLRMSQLFASGGQSVGASASASVLPMNSQDWFPLGLTGLISL